MQTTEKLTLNFNRWGFFVELLAPTALELLLMLLWLDMAFRKARRLLLPASLDAQLVVALRRRSPQGLLRLE